MLIDGIEYGEEFKRIAGFLGKLDKLGIAYISVPTRPPTEKWVKPARKEVLNDAFQEFFKILGSHRIKFLVEHEENSFSLTGKIEDDILSIAAVHPIRKEVVASLLKRVGADWQIVEKLLQEGKLIKLKYGGNEYYRSKLR